MQDINALIEQGLQQSESRKTPRNYLGASSLGDACDRRIQYQYLGTKADHEFTGKQLKTFAMGHLLEDLIISWMQLVGFELSTRNKQGDQYSFEIAGGKIAGHIDGVLLSGPSGFAYPALWECKTMNQKYWRDCVTRGLALSHPHYFAQVQLYMAYMQLDEHPALVTILNKDSSELHHEWIQFDAAIAQRYSDRAAHILKACQASEWLPRIAKDPNYFVCKSCRWQKTCWNG